MDGFAFAYWSAAALVLLSAAMITSHTWEHRRFSRSRVRNPIKNPRQWRIALFVPCKGLDEGLENNLRPLFEQDQGNYSLTLIVESHSDPACPVIERLLSQYPDRSAKMLVAGLCETGGQKVHNLLAATKHLADDVEVLAFVDTDVSPPSAWLRLLTQHLYRYGASTGYRCFIPERPTLANLILACINSTATGMMFPGRHHLVWGGSWAIRRDIFEAIRLRDAWRGTLSDDMMATRTLAGTSERIAFEPSCVVASPIDMSFRQMASFLRRQLAIGRCCAPLVWSAAFALHGSTQILFWGSIAAAIWGFSTDAEWATQPAAVAVALYVLWMARAWLRSSATKAFLPQVQPRLRAAHRFELWLGPLAGLTTFCGLISSAVGKRIVWRGIEYEMRIGGQARRVSPPLTVSAEAPQRRAA